MFLITWIKMVLVLNMFNVSLNGYCFVFVCAILCKTIIVGFFLHIVLTGASVSPGWFWICLM